MSVGYRRQELLAFGKSFWRDNCSTDLHNHFDRWRPNSATAINAQLGRGKL